MSKKRGLTDMILLAAAAGLALFTATTLCTGTATCGDIVETLVIVTMLIVLASLVKGIPKSISR